MAEFPNLIQKYLTRLHACIAKEKQASPKLNIGSASDLVGTISQTFQTYAVKENLKATLCSIVFSESYGFLSFLKSIILMGPEVRPIKVDIFKLLDDFFDIMGASIVVYGPNIKDLCMMYVKQEKLAIVRVASLVTLSKVLELCQTLAESDSMAVKRMIEDLFLQLSFGHKLPARVKEEVCTILGVVAHYYPQDFIPYSERVLMIYLQEIKKQMNSKATKPELSTVAGCLHGLKEYLFNFTVSYEEDINKSYQIFECVKRAILADLPNHTICKVAMQLLASHSSQFGIFLYESYDSIYDALSKSMNSANRELQKVSLIANIAVLKQIAEILPMKIEENKSFAVKVFNYFMEKFKATFLERANNKQLNIAAVGYGLFSAACKLLLDKSEVKKMLINIIQRSDYLFFNESNNLDEVITLLPAFLEALSSIISEIDIIPETLLLSIEKLVIFQIEKFPHVPSSHRFLAAQAVTKVLLALQPKTDVFKSFLSHIVYRGLVRTFSQALVMDIEADREQNNEEFVVENPRVKSFTYKNYLYLWSALLNVVKLKEYNAMGIPLSARQSLRESIYDEMIRCILSFYQKLDLSAVNKDSKNEIDIVEETTVESSSDMIHGLQPSNMPDCRIFINLVDFCREFLMANCIELFEKWVFTFGRETIHYSTKYPFISGFYKLVALNLNICAEIKYFKDIHTSDEDSCGFSINKAPKECECSFQLFSKFSREVVVYLQQFKDDLLASCLLIILALPNQIVENELHVLIPALQTTLKLGLGYLPLASIGLRTLKRWCSEVPQDKMIIYYPVILPLLNQYLVTPEQKGGDQLDVLDKATKPLSKKGHKISAKYVKAPVKISPEMYEESELMKLQLEIIQFLGKLGNEHNKAMLEQAFEKAETATIAWDFGNRHHLKYAVPFVDMKPEIYFDDFLPRVLELATASGDRQVKVVACEVLHSMVLYIIGRGSQLPEKHQQKMSMEELYKHLLPGLLQLACDVDQVVKQLFQPLVFQLTHWFTHRKTILTPESQAILLSLWDGATHPENAALRDFSALCLKEYLLWTIKQSSKNQDNHIKNFFKKLYSFAIHPSPNKRLGSALVFNNIYIIFRNEEKLVKQYSLELLVAFVESLAIAHSDSKSLGSQKLCLEALDHIKRILVVKASVFAKPHASCRKPTCLEQADLKSVVTWLYRQCGCIQTECRRKCMELVITLVILVPGISRPSEFIQTFLKEENVIKEIFECKLCELGVPPLPVRKLSSKMPITWMEALACSLECYTWCFMENMMCEDQETQFQSSKILQASEFFIEEIVSKSLPVVIRRFGTHDAEDVTFSPKEILQYDWTKCSVLIRLFTLLMSLEEHSSHLLSKRFFECLWKETFWQVVLLSVVDPSSLGFDTSDPDVVLHLSNNMSKVLRSRRCHKEDFMMHCETYLSSNRKYDLDNNFPVNFSSSEIDHLQLAELVTGFRILSEASVWPNKVDVRERTAEKLVNNLWDDFVDTSNSSCLNVSASPSAFHLANSMLSLCDSFEIKTSFLVGKLLDPLPITSNRSTEEVIKKGALIFSLFEEKLSEIMCKSADEYFDAIISQLSSQNRDAMILLVKLLNCVSTSKHLQRQYGNKILELILRHWLSLHDWCELNSDRDGLDSALSLLTNVFLLNSKVGAEESSLFKTFKSLMMSPKKSLDFKVHVLDLVPFFTEKTSEIDSLRNCLDMFIAMHFPLDCKELLVGSSQYNTYVSAVKKLLTALELTGSALLLEILTVLFCKEEKHCLRDKFEYCLHSLIKHLPPHRHQELAEGVFDVANSSSYRSSPDVQYAIVDRVCLTLLGRMPLSAFTNFYIKNVKRLMETLKQAKCYVASARKSQITTKICAFKLLELLYGRLHKDQLHTLESQIVHAYVGQKPDTGKELTTDLIKMALEFKKETVETDANVVESNRQLSCAAFNTLVAVVSCTQSDVKFYNAFIFKENPAKGERVWEALIDVEKTYNFDIEHDETKNRRKQFVSLRHSLRHGGDEDLNIDSDDNTNESSFHMIASQYLTMGSLAEDVSKFDFSTSEKVLSSQKNKASEKGVTSKDVGVAESVDMEVDELNAHECMVSMSFLIQHMLRNGLIPETLDSYPSWLDGIVKCLEGHNVKKNVKIFLARVVTNNAKAFNVYGQYLLKPLMGLIVSMEMELNSFILDVILTMLSWAPAVLPEDNPIHRHSANCVLEFLIKNCSHARRDIFRNNFEIIRTLLECWKDRVDIPYSAIYEQLRGKNHQSKKSLVGIQLLGILLGKGLPPFTPGCHEEEILRFNILSNNMYNKYKEVYASATEVTGMILKQKLDNGLDAVFDAFYKGAFEILVTLHHTEVDKFIFCLHTMHKFCPRIVPQFLSKLLYLQPSVHGIYQTYILDLLCSCVGRVDDGYFQLKSIGLFEEMEHKEEAWQLILLEAIGNVCLKLPSDEILRLLPIIVPVGAQPAAKCRLALFKTLMSLYDKYKNNDGGMEIEITRISQEALLSALADPDLSLRLTVDNFWSSEERLPTSTKERLLALMNNMYSPPTEDVFLQYTTFLLLERTSRSPDYKRKIFEHPLSDCNFLAYNISTSWRQRYAAMTPMFVDSMSSTLASSTLDAISMSTLRNHDGLIQATQQQQGDFSATQDTDVRSSTFNWLTNKSLDTFQDWGPSSSLSSHKSHLFTMKKPNVLTKQKEFSKAESTNGKERSNVWLLRKRFVKDRSSQSDMFARRESWRKDVRQELQTEQKRRREAEVTMYRQYRIGELPDIEIPNSALIAPLQALAQNDTFIAKLLCKSLVISICEYVEKEEPEVGSGYTEEVCQNLCQILKKSTNFVPTVISFCLESLHHFGGKIVDPEDVFVSSLKSNQQSLGILLLESKILASSENVEEPRRKKAKQAPNVIPETTTQWIKLSGLHRSVFDYDVCNGIFSIVMGGEKVLIQKALALETQGQYAEAVKLYEELFESATEENDQAEKDFLDNSLLFCYDRLTEWETLEEISVSRVVDPENPELQRIWEDPYFINNYLPYVVRSKLKCLIQGTGNQSLLTFVDTSSIEEDRKTYLEDHFVEEMALLYIIQEKFDSAQYYSSICISKFLKEWKGLSSLATSVQESKLQCVQKYIELEEFLELITREKLDNFQDVQNQIDVWQKRSPCLMDPPNIWDDIVSNRQLYFKKLKVKSREFDAGALQDARSVSGDLSGNDSQMMEDSSVEDIESIIMEHIILQKLSFAKYCTVRDNVSVSLKHLKHLLKDVKKHCPSLWPNFIGTYCLANHHKALKLQGEEKLECLLSSWSQLGKIGLKSQLTVSQKILQSETLEMMAEVFSANDVSLSMFKETNRDKIRDIAQSDIRGEILEYLHVQSFDILKETVSNVRKDDFEKDHTTNQAFMSLANYCNKYLRLREAETDKRNSVTSSLWALSESYPKVLVESLLSALRHGNKQALQLFPRLLQVIELYKEALPVFVESVVTIPSWMFLGWVNQMLALLDKPEARAVHTIVQNICIQYPNAIVYNLRLSCESYSFVNDSSGRSNKAFVERMKDLLSGNRLITDFITALGHLSVPLIIFKDYMVALFRLLSDSSRDAKAIEDCYKKMWRDLFDVPQRCLSIGPIQKQFAKDFSGEVLKIGYKNLIAKKYNVLKEEFMALYGKMKKADSEIKKKGYSLKNFSPWLSDFRAWKHEIPIEIPGQYTGKSKPMTEYHIKIAGFDEKVLILSSITQPRRITIRGNDEKEYKILIKAGEDLRQDSRIEQLFSLMNDIYSNDPECGKRHLKLATYKVIPISTRLGIIEWVDNTMVLNDFLTDSMTQEESKKYRTSSGCNNVGHAKIVKLAGGETNPTLMYKSLHKKSRDECMRNYEEIVRDVPQALLKRSFLRLSSSPEAFVRLRTRFAMSHAVICVSQWLLGIGDRHLGNFLIDMTSGQEIGIDFGHAFGSATQFQAVPEFVPFRLTPQYLQLMSPLKEKGIIEATMVHALAALRKNDYLLLNIMDIFIKEPTLDWKANAAKQQQDLGITEEEIQGDENWYPKQRVEIALNKLQGANPCQITRKELQLGHGGDQLFEKYEALCIGDTRYNTRAKLPATQLTVEQQVSCLIDQATDPHILCKTYFGWNPWM